MARWVVGTEESTIVQESAGLPGRGSLPGRGAPAGEVKRAPAGAWHAIDATTNRPACGSRRYMEIFPELAWGGDGAPERCAHCVEEVAPTSPTAR